MENTKREDTKKDSGQAGMTRSESGWYNRFTGINELKHIKGGELKRFSRGCRMNQKLLSKGIH